VLDLQLIGVEYGLEVSIAPTELIRVIELGMLIMGFELVLGQNR